MLAAQKTIVYVVLVALLLTGCGGGGGPVATITSSYTIAASADDGHFARTSAGAWSISSGAPTVAFGRVDIFGWYVWRGFFRFELDIPVGATILSANYVFIALDAPGALMPTAIKLIDDADCGDINSFAANQADMSFTGDEVAWVVPTTGWTGGDVVTSPDIATLVQAYIDLPGYAPGQNMGVQIPETAIEVTTFRGVASFDNATYAAPVLTVTYLKRFAARP